LFFLEHGLTAGMLESYVFGGSRSNNHLVRIHPSPVAHLNRAVAIAMRDGPEAGLKHIDAVLALANWQIITWRIQPVQICAAGWAGRLRPGPRMRKLWR
jgi:hypothetical protein